MYKRQEYTLPNVSQTVIITRMEGRTPVPETEQLAKLAAHGATMVIFLSIGLVDKDAACLPTVILAISVAGAIAVSYTHLHRHADQAEAAKAAAANRGR